MGKRGLDASSGANRTRAGTDVASNGNVPTHGESPDSVLAIQHDDEVRNIRANLEPPSYTTRCNARGC